MIKLYQIFHINGAICDNILEVMKIIKDYPYIIITFPSVHHAMKFELTLKDKLSLVLVPVPREISASCGVAAKISFSDLKLVKKQMKGYSLKWDAIYLYEKCGLKPSRLE